MSGEETSGSRDNLSESARRPLDVAGEMAKHQMERGDVAGVPTWPIPTAETVPSAPPVGLNWGTVAERLGADQRILQHEGGIVLAGEYFTEGGYFVHPVTLQVRPVDVGDIALKHGYFVGSLTLSGFNLKIQSQDAGATAVHPIIPTPPKGPIIGLFSDERDALRAKRKILQGSLGSGLSLQTGPLGVELRVERLELPGRVATAICAHAGAVISVGGVPTAPVEDSGGAPTTGPAERDMAVDARRPGTGVSGETEDRPGGPEDTDYGKA